MYNDFFLYRRVYVPWSSYFQRFRLLKASSAPSSFEPLLKQMINVCQCKFLRILQPFFLQMTRNWDSQVLRFPKNENHDGDLSILLCATEFSLYKYRFKDSSNAHRHTLSASKDTFFISIVHGEGIKAVVRWLDADLPVSFERQRLSQFRSNLIYMKW